MPPTPITKPPPRCNSTAGTSGWGQVSSIPTATSRGRPTRCSPSGHGKRSPGRWKTPAAAIWPGNTRATPMKRSVRCAGTPAGPRLWASMPRPMRSTQASPIRQNGKRSGGTPFPTGCSDFPIRLSTSISSFRPWPAWDVTTKPSPRRTTAGADRSGTEGPLFSKCTVPAGTTSSAPTAPRSTTSAAIRVSRTLGARASSNGFPKRSWVSSRSLPASRDSASSRTSRPR